MYHLPSKKSVNGTTYRPARPPRPPSQSSKTVLVSVHVGPPTLPVDSTVFEMWLGSLSAHRGLSIPVV